MKHSLTILFFFALVGNILMPSPISAQTPDPQKQAMTIIQYETIPELKEIKKDVARVLDIIPATTKDQAFVLAFTTTEQQKTLSRYGLRPEILNADGQLEHYRYVAANGTGSVVTLRPLGDVSALSPTLFLIHNRGTTISPLPKGFTQIAFAPPTITSNIQPVIEPTSLPSSASSAPSAAPQKSRTLVFIIGGIVFLFLCGSLWYFTRKQRSSD